MERGHRPRTGALLVTLVMAIAGVTAQQDARVDRQQAAGPARSAARVSEPGSGEGIHVHGHWTIVVRNPNGAVAFRTEFENALEPTAGTSLLARLLARQVSLSAWIIEIGRNTQSWSPCFEYNTKNFSPCYIAEPGTPVINSQSRNLTLAVSADGKTLSLAGSVVAEQDAAIDLVGTDAVSCEPTYAPAGGPSTMCPSGYHQGPLTRAGLPAPVNVTTGQTIQITVVISFS